MNNNQPDINQNRLEALLKVTAERLGTTPQSLKNAAQNGELAKLLNGAGSAESAAMQRVLNDPEAAKKLLSTPQAQKLLQMLQGGK